MVDATAQDVLPLTDADDALRRAGNRPEIAREMFDLLRRTLDEVESGLLDAFRNDDAVRLREVAHRLHGASLYCGVPRLHAAVAELERLCRERSDDTTRGLERTLERLLEVVAATRKADDPLAA